MTKALSTRSSNTPAKLSISSVLGAVRVLPGEDIEVYHRGLAALIEELGASNHLQLYLVEQIYDCIWSIQRSREQKWHLVALRMAMRIIKGTYTEYVSHEIDADQGYEAIMEELGSGKLSEETQKLLRKHKIDLRVLRAEVQQELFVKLQKIDVSIDERLISLQRLQNTFCQLQRHPLEQQKLRQQIEYLQKETKAVIHDVRETA